MKNLHKTLRLSLLIVAIFLVSFGLEKSGVLNFAERSLLDSQFRLFQREDPNKKVVLVSIDEKSLAQFAKNNMYWPWPREFYQLAVDYLDRQGAEAIVFDILFDTPDFDRINVSGSRSDQRFASALQRSGNGVLALKTTESQVYRTDAVSGDSLFDYTVEGSWPETPPHQVLSYPIDAFSRVAAAIGNTNMTVDQDGIVRKIRLLERTEDGTPIPSLPLATYLAVQDNQPTIQWDENMLHIGDRAIPVDRSGQYRINWYGKGGVNQGTFPYYSFGAVMQSAIMNMRNDGGQPPIEEGIFEDKIVIIGASAAGLSDIKATPFSSLEAYPGMEIHATALNNLLDNLFIQTPGTWVAYGLAFLLIVLVVMAVDLSRPAKGTLYTLGILLAVIGIEALLFTGFRYVLPLGFYLSSGFLAFTGSLGYKYVTEEREKKIIKEAFNHYVQPELVEEIVNQRNTLALGGDKKELTVMFSDLEGFTTLSEKTDPEKLLRILNRFLGAMTEVIFSHKGTIDKFIGDAVIAFWGAPLDLKDHPIHACRSALNMVQRLEELNILLEKENLPKLSARFGINTGEMIVGNVGSENRFNYTVIGDSVNLAARLETLNRLFGTSILISEDTYKLLKDQFICRRVGTFVVKGRTQEVLVFELMHERSEVDAPALQPELRTYREGLEFYEHRKWEEALHKFESLLENNPDDSLVETYAAYCKHNIEFPPGESWSKTFTLNGK